jgi:hypothetical protein
MVGTFTYTWERCNGNGRVCAPIPHASSPTHTTTAADLGHALVVLVQASNSATIQNAFSQATPAVAAATVHGPVALTLPEVIGSEVAGSQLIAATGRWQGVGPVSFAFQWYRCDLLGSHCAVVTGADGATYRLGALDAGMTIGLTLRVSDLTGTTTAYTSLAGPVAPLEAALRAVVPPTLSGTPAPGSTLQASAGSWSQTPTAFSYQWLLCNANGRLCSPIQGATTASYTVAAGDAGHTLIAEVQATLGPVSQLAFSPASAAVD